jgi:hypothetical protein
MSLMLLATILAFGVPTTNAVTLNATDDGLSPSGMFFSKLETIRSKLISGDSANVRMQALSQIICIIHICTDTSFEIQYDVFVVQMINKSLFMRS